MILLKKCSNFFVKLRKTFNWQAYLAEFIGTFVFVLVSSGAVLSSVFNIDINGSGVAIATGLILTAMVYSTVGISGGHLNPAVTLAMWFAEKISVTNAVFYICVQLLASISASYLLLWIYGQKSIQFILGGPIIGADITAQTAIAIEAILTAALIFAVFATTVDRRGPVSFGPLVIGMVVLASGIFAGPLTGAALNPARAFGPLLVSGTYSSILVWIIGPFSASVLGFVYKYLFIDTFKKGQ